MLFQCLRNPEEPCVIFKFQFGPYPVKVRAKTDALDSRHVPDMQDILYDASAGGFCFYSIEFFKTVYDKMADPQLHSKGDIRVGLVVAVEKCLAQIIACFVGTEDLSAGDDIDPHSFFFHYLIYILKRICLAGIERTGISAEVFFESLGIGTAVLPDSLFVH